MRQGQLVVRRHQHGVLFTALLNQSVQLVTVDNARGRRCIQGSDFVQRSAHRCGFELCPQAGCDLLEGCLARGKDLVDLKKMHAIRRDQGAAGNAFFK